MQISVLKTVSAGFLTVIRYLFELNGTQITRDILDNSIGCRGVAALLYDPVLNKVLLVREMQGGTLLNQQRRGEDLRPLPMVPAGKLEKGEDAHSGIVREVKEETGLDIQDMPYIITDHEVEPSPGVSRETVTCYIFAADLSKAGGIHGSSSEIIESALYTPEELEAMIKSNEIKDMKTRLIARNFLTDYSHLSNKWFAVVKMLKEQQCR